MRLFRDLTRTGYFILHAVEKPTKGITVIGMWLLLGPLAPFCSFFFWEGIEESAWSKLLITMVGLGAATILYRTTRNYVAHVRTNKSDII
jgi:hypothetical protein